jgi:hypothetical protein
LQHSPPRGRIQAGLLEQRADLGIASDVRLLATWYAPEQVNRRDLGRRIDQRSMAREQANHRKTPGGLRRLT